MHPALLAGLAAAAVLPAAIHLASGRRARRVPFAAIALLGPAGTVRARGHRLRDRLLWLLRTLLLAALSVALARPVWQAAVPAPAAPRRLAVVLDTSASMAYRQGGTTLLAAARARALAAIAELTPGDAATVILTGPAVRPLLPAPSVDLGAVRRALAEVSPCGGAADVGSAIAQAAQQLGTVAGSTAEILVIGDLARGAFAALGPLPAPAPAVRLLDAADRPELAPLPNVALEALVPAPAGTAAAFSQALRLSARNFGAAPVPDRAYAVRVDGREVQRGHLALPARGQASVMLTITPAVAAPVDVEVALAPDAADGRPDDDTIVRRVEVGRKVSVLAIDGAPRAVPYDDELFFVERALAAVPAGTAPIDWTVAEVAGLAAPELDLAAYDVVLLANVGELPAAAVARLGAHLGRGGGLVVAFGDQLGPEAVNASYGVLLPQPLRAMHRLGEGAAAAAVGLGADAWEHPLLRDLGPAFEAGLAASRTLAYGYLEPAAATPARTILRFADGTPALLEGGGPGPGRCLVWTSTLDVDGTDLPLRPAFVALTQRLLRYAAGADDGALPEPVRAGAQARLLLPPGQQRGVLAGPAGDRVAGALPVGAAAGTLTIGPLETPGFYRAEVGSGGAQQTHPAPRLDVAVWPDLSESDYAPVDPADVAQALAARGGPAITVAVGSPAEAGQALPPATVCLVAVACLALAEAMLVCRRRVRAAIS